MAPPLRPDLKAPKRLDAAPVKIEWRDNPPSPMKGIFKKVSIWTLVIAVFLHVLHYLLAALGIFTEETVKYAETGLDKITYVALAIMFACLGGKVTGKAADMIKMFKKKEPTAPQ